jgi:mono/diheme cytochrome c family protein
MCIWRAVIAVAFLGVAPLWVRAGEPAPSSAPAKPPVGAGQSTPAAPAGNADAGQQVFVKKGCYACHGREGQGSPTTGPRLGPGPASFATFSRSIRAPRAQMPPYAAKVLSDAELADIYAFLQARPRPISIDTLVPQ